MWGHGKEWERRGVWETGSVTYVFMEKVLSFFLVIVTACSNGVFISVLSPSWKGHTCHNSPSLSVNSHLDAGGLVPVRHLGEGRLGLKSPVVSLGDAVGDTVLGVQISLDIGRRNGCTQNWRHQSWSDLVTNTYTLQQEQRPCRSGIPYGRSRQISPLLLLWVGSVSCLQFLQQTGETGSVELFILFDFGGLLQCYRGQMFRRWNMFTMWRQSASSTACY